MAPPGNRLYVLDLRNGRNHPAWHAFFALQDELGGKAPDDAGVDRLSILASTRTIDELYRSFAHRMSSIDGLKIEEITQYSLRNRHSHLHPVATTYFKFVRLR